MKKIILLLTFTVLSFSCNKDDDNSSGSNNNTNGNSFTNSMDYEFTITINGEVHKVRGNTTNGIPVGQTIGSFHYIMNTCIIQNHNGKTISLGINDVTASNYVSGQNTGCGISFPNLLLGVNTATVYFRGAYFDTLCTDLGAYTLGSGFGISSFQSVSGAINYAIQDKLPITITDLGTTGKSPTYTGNPYNFGETVKGNYSGTIYLKNTSNGNFTIPVQLSIDFKAIRMY